MEAPEPLKTLSVPEDEKALIGCLILDSEISLPVIKKHHVSGSWFDDLRNRVWFDKILATIANGHLVTVENVVAEFNGELPRFGGAAYYRELMAAAPTAYAAEDFIPRLREMRARRITVQMAIHAASLAQDLTVPPADILPDFQRSIETLLPARNGLPGIVDACAFTETTLTEPKQLISGILHQGSKMVLGGGSKSFKTWQLLDLAVSVSHQLDWLRFQTCFGKVLYVNFEIQDFAWQARVRTIARAKGVDIQSGRLTLWNLRGFAADYKTLLPRIQEAITDAQYSMIILDPAYKLYGEADENSAGDIAGLCNAIESLAVKTGAAVVFGAHFSKGNQSGKEAIDRVSGSGVFARDPDSLITLTRHEEDGCFSVEPILRNFPHLDPFVVRWQFPLMVPQDDLNPDDLKKQAGRKREYDPVKLLAEIASSSLENPVSISAWAENAGIPRQTLTDYLPKLRHYGWVLTTGEGKSARQYITQKGKDSLP